MKKHLNIIISGELREKGFRFSAMQKAYEHSISGFVRRKRDGRIYIEAEGDEENLNNYLEWCRKGPLGTIVYNVQVEEGDSKDFSTFEIKRR